MVDEVKGDELLDALSPAVPEVQDGVHGGREVVPWRVDGDRNGALGTVFALFNNSLFALFNKHNWR